MQRFKCGILTFTLVAVLSACDAEDPALTAELAELSARQNSTNIQQELSYPGNGDIELHEGDSATDPGCLIADLGGPTVFEGPQTLGNILWNINEEEGEIYDSAGALACTVERTGQQYELQDPTGTVVASLWKNLLFYGDVKDIRRNQRWWKADFAFRRDHVVEGNWFGPEVVTATEHIAWAKPERRMVIAAFTMGICGSPGAPPLEEPAN